MGTRLKAGTADCRNYIKRMSLTKQLFSAPYRVTRYTKQGNEMVVRCPLPFRGLI